MKIPEEEKIVIEICRAEIDPGYEFPEKLVDNADWEKIITYSANNGLNNLVYNFLTKHKNLLDKVPGNNTEKLKHGYYGSLTKNARILKELGDILKVFALKGLDVILLKGAALIETVYKNPALRAMSDVDILIRVTDFKKIDECLSSCGYELLEKIDDIPVVVPYLNTYTYHKEGGSIIFHLHWHFINSTIPTHSYIFNVDMNKVWEEALSLEMAEAGCLVLAPHHLLMHLSEHGLRVRHSFDRLILLVDIAKVIFEYDSEIDWEKIVRQSNSFNLNRMVYYSLYLCREYFNIGPPEYVMENLRPGHSSVGERYFLKNSLNNRRRAGLSYFIHLAMNDGIKQKSRFVYRTLFPPKDVLRHRMGEEGSINPLGRIREVVSRIISNMS